jgi:hypothetical protein
MKKKSWFIRNGERTGYHEAIDTGGDSEDNSDDSCKGVLPTVNKMLENNIEVMVWLEWPINTYITYKLHLLHLYSIKHYAQKCCDHI